ncbi:MAG TPA: hypothetical protein PLE92_02760 [Lentisphaeria bacterium]|nr:hypothetical protein [Lentisphaeria bacterium]
MQFGAFGGIPEQPPKGRGAVGISPVGDAEDETVTADAKSRQFRFNDRNVEFAVI